MGVNPSPDRSKLLSAFAPPPPPPPPLPSTFLGDDSGLVVALDTE
jgi:hypothetical protein